MHCLQKLLKIPAMDAWVDCYGVAACCRIGQKPLQLRSMRKQQNHKHSLIILIAIIFMSVSA
jgi:hypothetical protein